MYRASPLVWPHLNWNHPKTWIPCSFLFWDRDYWKIVPPMLKGFWKFKLNMNPAVVRVQISEVTRCAHAAGKLTFEMVIATLPTNVTHGWIFDGYVTFCIAYYCVYVQTYHSPQQARGKQTLGLPVTEIFRFLCLSLDSVYSGKLYGRKPIALRSDSDGDDSNCQSVRPLLISKAKKWKTDLRTNST